MTLLSVYQTRIFSWILPYTYRSVCVTYFWIDFEMLLILVGGSWLDTSLLFVIKSPIGVYQVHNALLLRNNVLSTVHNVHSSMQNALPSIHNEILQTCLLVSYITLFADQSLEDACRDNKDAMLQQIRCDLRAALPLDATLQSEKIVIPTVGEVINLSRAIPQILCINVEQPPSFVFVFCAGIMCNYEMSFINSDPQFYVFFVARCMTRVNA